MTTTQHNFIECGGYIFNRDLITAVGRNGSLNDNSGGYVILRNGERLPLLPEELAALWQALTAENKRFRNRNL